MRSFVISVIILLICFTVASANYLWTRSAINTLLDDIEMVSADGIDELIEKWDRTKTVLYFTTRSSLLRDLEAELQHLRAAADSGDELEINTSKSSIIYKMKEICRSHGFDLKSIL
ncbi:MAG: DUF4363 family protein [Clostridia bacterium]|nr:DUF4363 family protein [Clostridia bacterium]